MCEILNLWHSGAQLASEKQATASDYVLNDP